MPSSAACPLLDAMGKRFENWCWKVTDQVRCWLPCWLNGRIGLDNFLDMAYDRKAYGAGKRRS